MITYATCLGRLDLRQIAADEVPEVAAQGHPADAALGLLVETLVPPTG